MVLSASLQIEGITQFTDGLLELQKFLESGIYPVIDNTVLELQEARWREINEIPYSTLRDQLENGGRFGVRTGATRLGSLKGRRIPDGLIYGETMPDYARYLNEIIARRGGLGGGIYGATELYEEAVAEEITKTLEGLARAL